MGRAPAFLCDGMLGSLARWLRLLGFDTSYADSTLSDADVLRLCHAENRVLLTRDQDLTRRARALGHPCVELADGTVLSQVQALLGAGTLVLDPVRFFSRCTRCNGELRSVPKALLSGRVAEPILARTQEFWECARCRHVYWKGTHVEEIQRRLLALGAGAPTA